MKTISIIIPVYNREQYIEKCLHSLTTQSYEKLEIIVVDNNSKDKTPTIVKKLAKDDQRIKYYNCKKQGVSAARNYGIEKATGTYISFVDSDDYCLPDMYQALYDEAQKNDSILTVCGVENRDESGKFIPPENAKSKYVGNDNVKKYLCAPAAVYGKLIKADYLKKQGITFRENISLAEDLAFVAELAAYTTKISIINEPYYVYVDHGDSLMHKINPAREYQIFEALGYIYGIYDKKAKILTKYHDEIERMFIANLVMAASTRYMIPENDKHFYEQAISFLRTHFSKWYQNKYYSSRGIKVKLYFWLYRKGLILAFRKLITRNNA